MVLYHFLQCHPRFSLVSSPPLLLSSPFLSIVIPAPPIVIPAKAGIQKSRLALWITAGVYPCEGRGRNDTEEIIGMTRGGSRQ